MSWKDKSRVLALDNGNRLIPYVEGTITNVTANDLMGVKAIKKRCFQDDKELVSVEIPEGVTEIGQSAFQSCIKLKTIIIPSTVTTIGNQACYYCMELESVKIYATTPPVLGDTYAFNTSTNKHTIYVPKGCLIAYQNATNWTSFSSRMVEFEE